MTKTATQEAIIMNLRKNRVMALVGEIMTELREDDRFPNDYLAEVHNAMAEVFMRNGAYIMTDRDRSEMGLEPRDFLGWTPSERVEQKRRELESLTAMMNVGIHLKEPKKMTQQKRYVSKLTRDTKEKIEALEREKSVIQDHIELIFEVRAFREKFGHLTRSEIKRLGEIDVRTEEGQADD